MVRCRNGLSRDDAGLKVFTVVFRLDLDFQGFVMTSENSPKLSCLTAEGHQLFVVFDDHAEEEDLQGDDMIGNIAWHEVLGDVGPEVVEVALVFSGEGVPEFLQSGALLHHHDASGWEGPTHGDLHS